MYRTGAKRIRAAINWIRQFVRGEQNTDSLPEGAATTTGFDVSDKGYELSKDGSVGKRHGVVQLENKTVFTVILMMVKD